MSPRCLDVWDARDRQMQLYRAQRPSSHTPLWLRSCYPSLRRIVCRSQSFGVQPPFGGNAEPERPYKNRVTIFRHILAASQSTRCPIQTLTEYFPEVSKETSGFEEFISGLTSAPPSQEVRTDCRRVKRTNATTSETTGTSPLHQCECSLLSI